MKRYLFFSLIAVTLLAGAQPEAKFMLSDFLSDQSRLGLPALSVPSDNPITKEKVILGEKLFRDERFSSTGKVSCSTCHLPEKGFTDSPLKVSEGIDKLTGTRNAPTVINAAYNTAQFWDGRSPDLEDQALHPFVNPVEMGLANHDPDTENRPDRPGICQAIQEGVRCCALRNHDQARGQGDRRIRAGDHIGQQPFRPLVFQG